VNTPNAPESGEPLPLPPDLQGDFKGLLIRLRESIIPEIHYLDDEEVQLVIRMADYRQKVPLNIVRIGAMLFIFAATIFLLTRWFLPLPSNVANNVQMITGVLGIVLLFLIFNEVQDLLLYEQWQFILTDKRIILITPEPDRHGFADAIYLKRDKIQVLDTNWSSSPLWGAFQAFKGTRDVMLSLSGYEFQEEGAKVKGGLRFPDVSPEDIRRLEILIFN